MAHFLFFGFPSFAIDRAITFWTAIATYATQIDRRLLIGEHVMSKLVTFLAIASLATSLVVSSAPARAEDGEIAAGVVGGLLGGALLGGALARPAPPPVYYPAPPAYVDDSDCRMVRQRFWDGDEWRMRWVQVCD
jgi:hypothetical protein